MLKSPNIEVIKKIKDKLVRWGSLPLQKTKDGFKVLLA